MFFVCRNTPMSKGSIVDYNPTEEQRKKNHYLSLGVQTMYIMADVHPESRYTIIPVICTCHWVYRPCTFRLQVHHLTCHFYLSLGVQTMYIMADVHPDSRYIICFLPAIFTCVKSCIAQRMSVQTAGTPSVFYLSLLPDNISYKLYCSILVINK